MTRRVIAGVFLGVVMTLSLAGIASAQGSGSGSGVTTTAPTPTTAAVATTIKKTAAASTARTGLNTGFLLLVGGGLTVIVLGARRLARTSALS
jgi:hypothetical protein